MAKEKDIGIPARRQRAGGSCSLRGSFQRPTAPSAFLPTFLAPALPSTVFLPGLVCSDRPECASVEARLEEKAEQENGLDFWRPALRLFNSARKEKRRRRRLAQISGGPPAVGCGA
ncbi:Hypothetical predicted protein [Marmota monax]|uniref:Uncharacterized protein n=1 Tax=Marmota monax TaxID=9995 RepID=A0A5E4CCA1_MARMO|nr:Hypothetical predicted protein [Marmota monax]